MKKKVSLVLLFILSVFLFVSCSKGGATTTSSQTTPTTSANTEVEVTDMVGRKMIVKPGTYKRVVCIGAGALRLYSYVGDLDKLAGVEDIDNENATGRPVMFDKVARPYFIAGKEVFNTLPSVGKGGPQAQAAEPEKILNCNPDIVISEYEDVDKANALETQIKVPVIVVKYGYSGVFDENVKNSITLLGKVFDKEAKAKTLNDFIASEKSLIEGRVKDINVSTQEKVYVCGLGNWGTTNHLMTAQNYAPFNVAKINNVVTGLANNGIQAIEEEKFVELSSEMDIMIIDAAAIKNIKTLSEDKLNMIKNTKAWKNDKVYLQMAYNAYYTNLEIALVNTWFNAKVVYPNLFSDIDMNQKLNEVTKAFLGKELANEINAYPMSFGGYGKVNRDTIFA